MVYPGADSSSPKLNFSHCGHASCIYWKGTPGITKQFHKFWAHNLTNNHLNYSKSRTKHEQVTTPKFVLDTSSMQNCNHQNTTCAREVDYFAGDRAHPHHRPNNGYSALNTKNGPIKDDSNIVSRTPVPSGSLSWNRKPDLPTWIRSHELIRLQPTPDTEKLPKVCPRFLMENKTRWNRFNQEWEPVLNLFTPVRFKRHHHSSCPFHKGYEIWTAWTFFHFGLSYNCFSFLLFFFLLFFK